MKHCEKSIAKINVNSNLHQHNTRSILNHYGKIPHSSQATTLPCQTGNISSLMENTGVYHATANREETKNKVQDSQIYLEAGRIGEMDYLDVSKDFGPQNVGRNFLEPALCQMKEIYTEPSKICSRESSQAIAFRNSSNNIFQFPSIRSKDLESTSTNSQGSFGGSRNEAIPINTEGQFVGNEDCVFHRLESYEEAGKLTGVDLITNRVTEALQFENANNLSSKVIYISINLYLDCSKIHKFFC